MCTYIHPRKGKRCEIELEFGDAENSILSVTVWAKYQNQALEAIRALFDSCRNHRCYYFQEQLARIELAFGY